jgi:hypothetical protein
MKIGSMNHSSEIHRLANSIAGLAATITEIINAKVKEAKRMAIPLADAGVQSGQILSRQGEGAGGALAAGGVR